MSHLQNCSLMTAMIWTGCTWIIYGYSSQMFWAVLCDFFMCYFCARRQRPSSSALPLPFQRDRSAITASPSACRKLKTKLLFLVFLSLFLRHLDWGGAIVQLLLPIHERCTNGRRNFRPSIYLGTVQWGSRFTARLQMEESA